MTEWALWQRKGTFLSVLSYTLSNSAHSTDRSLHLSFNWFQAQVGKNQALIKPQILMHQLVALRTNTAAYGGFVRKVAVS